MNYKIVSFLFICLFGLQTGCQTGAALVSVPDNAVRQTVRDDISDEKIKQLFVDSGLHEDDGFYKELMTCPKERIIAVVQKIKENGLSKNDEKYQNERADEILKMKAASFLWTLGVEREANEKYIVDIAKKKDWLRFYAIDHVAGFISEGKKEYFPIVFEDALKWDGAFLYIQAFLLDELENSPKSFLFYLSKEPVAVRKRIYEVITLKGDIYDEKSLEKIKSNVEKLKADDETKTIAAEFLREVDKKTPAR
jgi:hypothetical protein